MYKVISKLIYYIGTITIDCHYHFINIVLNYFQIPTYYKYREEIYCINR